MTMTVQQQANTECAAVTRTDLMHLLQEAGRPEQLDVSGQDLRGINLMNCNLEGANLSQARVCEANLCGAKLSKADLHGADLRGTYLCWADLRGVKLERATLYGASLGRADLRGALLDKTDLRGADLSWACLGGANTCERTRSHLRRRGAIFREKTNVIVAERFSENVGRYALGFGFGLLCMNVVGFLMVLGIRFIFTHTWLNRHPVDH
jgi:uncharacterized protein YjbI with pentapeptide repeats